MIAAFTGAAESSLLCAVCVVCMGARRSVWIASVQAANLNNERNENAIEYNRATGRECTRPQYPSAIGDGRRQRAATDPRAHCLAASKMAA